MSTVSASEWIKGISLSILASIIGGASKLAIRKSWLMLREYPEGRQQNQSDTNISSPSSSGNGDDNNDNDDILRMSTDY